MENKINIAQLLKEQGVPSGTKFYTTLFGDCIYEKLYDEFIVISGKGINGIITEDLNVFGELYRTGECVLFPSKDNRDWSKYKYEIPELTVEEITEDYLNKTIGNFNAFLFDTNPKLQAIIKMLAVADYLNDGWIVNWSSHSNKFAIELSGDTFGHCDSIFSVVSHVYSNTSPIIFKTKELAEKAIKMLGEETIRTALS